MFIYFGPERIVAKAAENHLRKSFKPGVYETSHDIDAILKHQISFYGNRLDKYLPLVASQHFMDFILNQYETAARIHRLYVQNKLSPSESARWGELEKNWRRTLKFIAERCTLIADVDPEPKEQKKLLMETTDEVLICAEQLVGYCILSDQTLFVRPTESRATINKVNSENYFDHTINDYSNVENYWKRVAEDRENREKFVGKLTPEFDVQTAARYLDPALEKNFELSLVEVLNFIRSLRVSCIPPAEGFPIPFCDKGRVVDSWAEELKVPQETINKMIAGFSLDRERMAQEGREFWNPKYEYRAYRRGIFEFPHATGTHLTFAPEMFDESLMMLIAGLSFKQIPSDWKSTELEEAVNGLSEYAGKWFEETVKNNMLELDFLGKSFNRSIGSGANRLLIPGEVGELDFLGTNEKEAMLLLIECKRTQPGAEPKFWRKDLSEFTEKKNNYAQKFRRKVSWVRENFEGIVGALRNIKLASETDVRKFAYCMITMYPNIASYSIQDFPCVSLVEFRLDHARSIGYPYSLGVESMN